MTAISVAPPNPRRPDVSSVLTALAGVTVGYALSATTSFLIFASHSREGVKAVLFWLLGSLDLLHQVGASDRVVARAGEYDVRRPARPARRYRTSRSSTPISRAWRRYSGPRPTW